MYNPSINQVNDPEEILGFIHAHPFGIIINTANNTPIASHLPFSVKKEGDHLCLYGHFARANAQWKELGSSKTLVIFSEPHAYISPTHYDNDQSVPTWNYCAIHCYGEAKIIGDEEGCMELLREMISAHDTDYLGNWDNVVDQEFKSKMLRGIVMFRIEVDEVQARYKLSQNKKREERQRISEYLKSSEHSQSREIGDMMSKALEKEPL